ncbi:MAG: VOC family protein [Caulobacterales bacterium]
MAKIIGLGGVFFKTADPARLRAWYADVLGLEFADWGGVAFEPAALAAMPGAGSTLAAFKAPADYFSPSPLDHMINLVVDDLDGVLARCAAAGVAPLAPLAPVTDDAMGRFAHLLDPDGRKIELQQPKPGG